ncbi:MAG: ACP S-malonyltransferase [Phycisphaeraceae bacterium]|nr:ACP S-malonyltransferase [Phycisphaeraceae bacterium]
MTDATPSPNNLLCPGQGSQHVGMGAALHQAHPEARQLFDTAEKILGIPLTRLCFEGPEEQLTRTDVTQVALYVCGAASFAVAQRLGRIGRIQSASGLSLGEFTALHLAGAFSFEDGLKIVQVRGRAMQEAATQTPSGMVALVGADERQAEELCGRARGDDILVPANFNCPGQVVVSGSKPACERALTVAAEMGLRATSLRVAGAFHSPIMATAGDKLGQAMEKIAWNTPTVPVISNVTAQPHPDDPASIRARLVEQLTSPVRWTQSMQWLLERDPYRNAGWVELAPGKVIAGLMRRIDRQVKVAPLSEMNLETSPAGG